MATNARIQDLVIPSVETIVIRHALKLANTSSAALNPCDTASSKRLTPELSECANHTRPSNGLSAATRSLAIWLPESRAAPTIPPWKSLPESRPARKKPNRLGDRGPDAFANEKEDEQDGEGMGYHAFMRKHLKQHGGNMAKAAAAYREQKGKGSVEG